MGTIVAGLESQTIGRLIALLADNNQVRKRTIAI
jgi:hypothetical protein